MKVKNRWKVESNLWTLDGQKETKWYRREFYDKKISTKTFFFIPRYDLISRSYPFRRCVCPFHQLFMCIICQLPFATKNTNTNCKYRKAARLTLLNEKAVPKMLMKLISSFIQNQYRLFLSQVHLQPH